MLAWIQACGMQSIVKAAPTADSDLFFQHLSANTPLEQYLMETLKTEVLCFQVIVSIHHSLENPHMDINTKTQHLEMFLYNNIIILNYL